jgi:beta-ketoacyl synthase-like protein
MSALGPMAFATLAGVRAAEVAAPRIRGAGLLGGTTGPAAGEPSALLTVPTPALEGERFRRATRECLLAVAAVRAALADAGLAETSLAGARTGLVYASATAYAAANRLFLEDEGSTTLHFPYTAPSAVPAEVTIAFGIRGPYVNLMGGGPAALQALWYAARWLADSMADRVLVLAVETVHEVWDLFGRARRLYRRPVVEGAACLCLEPGGDAPLRWASAATTGARSAGRAQDAVVEAVLDAVLADAELPGTVGGCGDPPSWGRAERAALARRGAGGAPTAPSAGEAMACGPLAALARRRASGGSGPWLQTAAWRNDYGAILWPTVMA